MVETVTIFGDIHHTLGDIRDEATGTEMNSIVDSINAGIQMDQCACDWRNPQGDCCLGNVKALMKKFRANAT